MRPLRSLLAFAVAAGASALLIAVPGTASASAPTVREAVGSEATETEASDDPALLVEVVPGAAGRVVVGADLTVSVRITNLADTPIPAGSASLLLDRASVGSAALAQWLAPATSIDSDAADREPLGAADDAITGESVADAATPALDAGDSRILTDFVVPAASLPFGEGSPLSVHRLSVTVDAGDEVVTERSAISVDPGTPVPVTRLAIAVPIALPPTVDGVIGVSDLETLTVEGGPLDLQVRQASVTSAAIGIDPRIIASINVLGDGAPESALAWLDRLRSVPNETFPLSYADADIAATSQAAGAVFAPAGFVVDPDLFPTETDAAADDTEVQPSQAASPDTPVPAVPTQEELLDWQYTNTDIAWPRDDSVVAGDLDVFAASGLTTSILSSTNTGDDAAGASASADGHRVFQSEASLSTHLRSAVGASTPFGRNAAVARMTAALAAISAGAGAAPPVVLATLDRSTPSDSFPLATTVAAVSAAPWAASTTLADVRAQPAAPVSIVDRPVDESRTTSIVNMLAQEPALGAFASVLADPVQVTGERRLSLLALCSQSWTTRDSEWPDAVAGYLDESNGILGSVEVGSRTLTQASDNGDLPIVVTNALDFPVTVLVNVRALRPIPILAIRDASVEVQVPANSQQRAPIPTESIANGEVSLEVTLTSATGVPVGEVSTVRVSVRAGWETAVTTVLAIFVVAVFILGIIRTVRRRRRIARGEVPDEREGDARDLHDGMSTVREGSG